MQHTSDYLKNQIQIIQQRHIRNVIFEVSIRLVILIAACLFLFYASQSLIPLYFLGALLVFVYFVTFVRWNKYFRDQRLFAEELSHSLKKTTSALNGVLSDIASNELPFESYRVNFNLDNHFKFEISLGFVELDNKQTLTDFNRVNELLNKLIIVNPILLKELEKSGWNIDAKFELTLELILYWFSDNWNQQKIDPPSLISTLKVKDREGYYNLKENRWDYTL